MNLRPGAVAIAAAACALGAGCATEANSLDGNLRQLGYDLTFDAVKVTRTSTRIEIDYLRRGGLVASIALEPIGTDPLKSQIHSGTVTWPVAGATISVCQSPAATCPSLPVHPGSALQLQIGNNSGDSASGQLIADFDNGATPPAPPQPVVPTPGLTGVFNATVGHTNSF